MADRSRDWLLAGFVVAVVMGVALLGAPPAASSRLPPDLSTLRSTPGGAKGLFLTLERLGLPVDRRLTPLADADSIAGPLALLAPTEALSPRELDALGSWLDAGGTLLYVARPNDPTAAMLGLHLIPLPPDSVERPDSLMTRAFEPLFGARRTARPTDHPWAVGLAPVHGFHWALVAARGVRATPVLEVPMQAPRQRRTLAVALDIRRGRGRVLAISDPGPLANREILADRLAPLFVRAAWEAVGGDRGTTPTVLRFDEYHHGARGGSIPGEVAAFLSGTAPGHAALQLLAVALLALAAGAIRFGAPLLLPEPRRSALEHVDALAQAYAGADVRHRGRLLLMAGLARRLGRPSPSSDDDAVALVSRLASSRPGAAPAAHALVAAIRDDAAPQAVAVQVDRLMTELKR